MYVDYMKVAKDLLSGLTIQPRNDTDAATAEILTAVLRRAADDPDSVAHAAKELEAGFEKAIHDLMYGVTP